MSGVLERAGALDVRAALCASIRAWARSSVTPGASRSQQLVVLAPAAVLAELLGRERQRHEHAHLRVEEEEALGQHADDVVDLVVQAQLAADDAVDAARLPRREACG